MQRRQFLTLTGALLFAGSAAFADTLTDRLVAQLSTQGFSEIRVGRTLLGRVRILATSAQYRREIIVNPRTGEILRDYLTLLDGDGGALVGLGEPAVPEDDDGGDDAGGDNDDDTGDDDDDDDGAGEGEEDEPEEEDPEEEDPEEDEPEEDEPEEDDEDDEDEDRTS